MEGGRQRLTLYDQMSAVDDSREVAGLAIAGALTTEKRAGPPAQLSNRTLLDIIRDEEPSGGKGIIGHRDKKSWKSFRDRLRLKRAGAAWTSSVPIPTSDIPIQSRRLQISRRNSVRFDTVSPTNSGELAQDMTQSNDLPPNDISNPPSRPQISRRSSMRFGPNASVPAESIESPENVYGNDTAQVRSSRPQMARHNSTRFSTATDDNFTDQTEPVREGTRRLSAALAEERSLSAREAVAAQEAAEAEAAEAAAASSLTIVEEEESGPSTEAAQTVRMSLMDLLEETDRQMGLVGSRYTVGLEDEEEEEEEYEEEDEETAGGSGGGAEYNCCVCMVRHKGAAFIPCGHTFCRLCSRELWVNRGNCPLCNGFILEILDIF